jgi:formate hydrogenlyase subunit 3/multisubunit Na+/H+ antiporter MnhD subunit
MSPVLWLIAIPFMAAPLVYLFRRTFIGPLIAAGVALFLTWLTLRLPLGLVITILGRAVELNQLSQILLVLLYATATILFFVTTPLTLLGNNSNSAGNGAKRGQTFHTVGLVTLSVFAAASLSRHIGITAILIEIAAIFNVFIIQGQRIASTRAAQRFLVLMTLALPLFLLAGWRIDQYQLSGGGQTSGYLQQTTVMVGLGFALWLAVWPFHSWQSITAADATPPTAVFVLTTFPIVIYSTLLNLLNASPWLVTASSLAWTMVLAGGITAIIAGILASVQRGFRPLLGYTALFDAGLMLATLGLGGRTTVPTILVGLIVRSLALALFAASLLAVQRHTFDDGFVQVTGLGRRLPIAATGLMIGGLTLIGIPLTMGFPLRWQLLQSIAAVDPRWPLLLVLAGLGVCVGYLRGLRALLADNIRERPAQTAPSLRQPRILAVMISILIVVCILLGVFPSLLIDPIQQISASIPMPIR